MSAGKKSAPVCVYASWDAETKQRSQIPDCDGPTCYAVRKYFVGEARKKMGPDMHLCRAHGPWWEALHWGQKAVLTDAGRLALKGDDK